MFLLFLTSSTVADTASNTSTAPQGYRIFLAILTIVLPILLNSFTSSTATKKAKNKDLQKDFLNEVISPIYKILHDKKALDFDLSALKIIKNIHNDNFLLLPYMQTTLLSEIEKSYDNEHQKKKYVKNYNNYKKYISQWYRKLKNKLGYPRDRVISELSYYPFYAKFVLVFSIGASIPAFYFFQIKSNNITVFLICFAIIMVLEITLIACEDKVKQFLSSVFSKMTLKIHNKNTNG